MVPPYKLYFKTVNSLPNTEYKISVCETPNVFKKVSVTVNLSKAISLNTYNCTENDLYHLTVLGIFRFSSTFVLENIWLIHSVKVNN